MTINYTTLLGLAKPVTGTESGAWGDVVNDQITSLVEDAIANAVSISVSAGNVTLSDNDGSTDQARMAILLITGSPGTSRNIVAPSRSKWYIVRNGSDSSVVVKGSATTGVTIAAGKSALVFWNGSDFATNDVIGTLPVSNGGTGATTLTGVLKGNGASPVTASNVNLASEVTGTLPVANGGTGVTSSTGSGAVVLSTSPTLVTPTLGVATATSVNDLPLRKASSNVAIGTSVLSALTSGVDNIGVGESAIVNTTNGQRNIAIGSSSLTNNQTGSFNIAIGASALSLASSASSNIGIGTNALLLTSGSRNVAIGEEAGAGIITGTNNTILGYDCDVSATNGTTQIIIGYALTGKGNNTAFIGGTSGAYNGKNVTTWETTSDARIKKNIVDNSDGLSKIEAIRVRNFEYRLPEEITELPKHAAVEKTGVQLGIIAQEMLPECVSITSDGVLSVNTDPLVWYLVNAVKELSAQIKALQDQLK